MTNDRELERTLLLASIARAINRLTVSQYLIIAVLLIHAWIVKVMVK